MTNENTATTDEPTKAELHDRVQQLESTVEKLMPSRRDALKLGAAGIAGAGGLSAATQPAESATGSSGQIGDSSNRPDIFADSVDTNSVTGVSNVADRQGCRVFLSSNQSISQSSRPKIQFDSKIYDSDSNFSTSSHNWTCPQDGLHLVNLQVRFTGGGNDEDRRVFIGTATEANVFREGALRRNISSDSQDSLSVSTVNKYAQGDEIAGYVENSDNNDSLGSGSGNTRTFLEVAFLGGL